MRRSLSSPHAIASSAGFNGSESAVLRWRLTLGLPIIGLVAALGWLDARAARPGTFLAPLGIALAWLAADELLRMFRQRGVEPAPIATRIAAVAPVVASCAPLAWSRYPPDSPIGRGGWLGVGLLAGLVIVLVAEMRRFAVSRQPMVSAAVGALAVLYVGGLMGMLVQLRLIEEQGLAALLSMIVVVKTSDIGQYVAGRMFGRRKLAPRLSPGKTREGLAGGIVAAVIAMGAMTHWIGPIDFARAGCAIAMALAGVSGDLAESMFKRDAGVKDSSTWLPGFGGVLDLLDSILFAAPVAYLCWTAGWM